MLAYKVFGSGVQGLAVQAICQDSESGITATGTNQSTAYSVTTAVASFGTVAAGTGAVLSSQAVSGDSQLVYNGGANPLNVYPPSGAAFNGLPVNIPCVLPVNTACDFRCLTSTLWTGVLSR